MKTESTPNDIRIYEPNPFYWQYKGKPVLLLGGSREDNLFNHPEGLAEHLDTLKAAGGNYIRNTMSSRNPGNPWAFKKGEDGLYDLEQWDTEYWDRFENLLRLCEERDIVVQIEIWDPWDYFKSEASLGYGPENVGWESCPFNPALNINYTAEESRLSTEITFFSKQTPSDHLFFFTIPELEDIPVVRQYQEAFVEKILSHTFAYSNVLYCMNNETGEPPEWGQYWARFIRQKANEAGKEVFLTDMRRNNDFSSPEQVNLLLDKAHFDFFEISQNNAHNPGQLHYDGFIFIRNQIKDQPKPLNNVKIYGGNIGSWTISVEEGTHRFWRSVFAGAASVRFHRPGPSFQFFGLGLSDLAQKHIRSMRMLTDILPLYESVPANELLRDRDPNEAYGLVRPGQQLAVYFTNGGEVEADLSGFPETVRIRWLDILENQWQNPENKTINGQLILTCPGEGQWVALVEAL